MEGNCEGKFDFNEYLLVTSDVLETETPVTIGGVAAVILAPGSATNESILKGPDLPKPPTAIWNHPRFPGSSFRDWGIVRQRKKGVTVLAEISAAVFRVKIDLDDSERIAAFSDALMPWFSLLCDWLGAGTGQNLSGVRTRQSSFSIVLWGVGPDGKDKHAQCISGITGNIPDRDSAITGDKWRRAIHQASSIHPLPVEYQLMVEARAAYERESMREAVISAASAAEVVLNSALRRHLRAQNEERVIESLLKNKAMERLKQVAATFNIYCPSGLQAQLIEVRNKAVHAGVVPSSEQTAQVLKLATELIETHSPLPW